ncbi:MAG: diguanylate cyclase [Spirochaetia bacterium]|nr:diguanylate cyclase [Spirochaetia bacterium]
MINKKDKILIVDDSSTNIEILTMFLSGSYTIYTSKESKKTFDIAKKYNIDLILLDVEMPELNGYEVCKILKDDPETVNIPVIFVTSKCDPEAEEEGLQAGAIDYVTKPFSHAIIKSRIKNHLKLKNYQDTLKELSMRDGLTGLFNKRKFEETIKKEFLKAARENTKLSLLMIDIDFFKKYNDHYGHLEGDICLKSVALAIDNVFQGTTGIAARFGGEEFVCLLPDSDQKDAIFISKTILKNIKKLGIPHKKSTVSDIVTISLGCVTMDFIDENMLFSDFLVRADQLLYKAKESGRNRICSGLFKVK